MNYWVKTFRSETYHIFDIEPGEEHLVEMFAPATSLCEWLSAEGLRAEKLLYRSKPQPAFLTTDDGIARALHRRWG